MLLEARIFFCLGLVFFFFGSPGAPGGRGAGRRARWCGRIFLNPVAHGCLVIISVMCVKEKVRRERKPFRSGASALPRRGAPLELVGCAATAIFGEHRNRVSCDDLQVSACRFCASVRRSAKFSEWAKINHFSKFSGEKNPERIFQNSRRRCEPEKMLFFGLFSAKRTC